MTDRLAGILIWKDRGFGEEWEGGDPYKHKHCAVLHPLRNALSIRQDDYLFDILCALFDQFNAVLKIAQRETMRNQIGYADAFDLQQPDRLKRIADRGEG